MSPKEVHYNHNNKIKKIGIRRRGFEVGQHSSSISPSGTHFTALFVHHAPGGRPAEKLIMPEKKKRRSDRRREGEEKGEKGRRSEATLTVQTKLNVPCCGQITQLFPTIMFMFLSQRFYSDYFFISNAVKHGPRAASPRARMCALRR